MRRIMMGLVVVSVMACDAEGMDEDAALGFEEGPEALLDEDRPMASGTNATVKLVSWVKEGEVVNKVHCDDFTQTAPYHCYCNADSTLTGVPNVINGPDQCVLCRWSDWVDGVCALTSTNDVDVQFVSNGRTMYTYNEDDVITEIPSGPVTDPAPSWTLSHCTSESSCPCTENECTCGAGYLGFVTQKAHGSGTTSTIEVGEIAKIQLGTGMCE